MKLAVVGSRTFDSFELFVRILDGYLEDYPDLELVSGGAKGADEMAEAWADANNIPCLVIPADWSKYGNSAGFVRNAEIWDNADQGIAFWDGESAGTKHSMTISNKQKKYLAIVIVKNGIVDFEDNSGVISK